jgi:hypothetical protein
MGFCPDYQIYLTLLKFHRFWYSPWILFIFLSYFVIKIKFLSCNLQRVYKVKLFLMWYKATLELNNAYFL